MSGHHPYTALRERLAARVGDDTLRAATNTEREAYDAARTCAFCGDRDPCWHGIPARAWRKHEGLDRCPDCAWANLTEPLYIPGESLADGAA